MSRTKVRYKPLIYRTNKFTEYMFNRRILPDNKNKITQSVKTLSSEVEEFKDYSGTLYKEVFEDFFLRKQKRIPDTDIDEMGELIGKPIHEQLKDLHEYKKLRNLTIGNMTNSLLALDSMSQVVNKMVKEIIEKKKEQEQQDGGDGDGGNNKNNTGGGDGKTNINIEQILSGLSHKFRNEIRKAIKRAHKDIKSKDKVEAILWGDEHQEYNQISPEKRVEIYKRIKDNYRLQNVIDLIGKLTSLVTSLEMQEVTREVNEYTDIELGGNIERMLPSQFYMLRNKILKALFYKNFLEKSLIQYKIDSRVKEGKGRVICLVDTSGSMDDGYRIDLAVAIAGAIVLIGKKQNRRVDVIYFDTRIRKEFLEAQKLSGEKLVELFTIGCGGGTDFTRALERGFELMDDRSDILMITDGRCDVDPEYIRQKKEEKKARIFMITLYTVLGGVHEVVDMAIAYNGGNNFTDISKIIKAIKK